MKKINKKLIMKVIKITFVVFVVIFLWRYFSKNINEIKDLEIKINWLAFCLAMLFYFMYKYTLASLWHYITKLMDCSIKYEKAVTAYLYSILGKYIPGKVFMLGARLTYYNAEKANLRKVTVCFFIENICTLLGSALLFLISLFFFPNEILENYKYLTMGLIIIFFICINPKIINFFLKILQKIIKRNDLIIPMNYLQMLKLVLLFVINWLCVGAGFYVLVYSLYPIPVSESLFVAGIFALSAIIGIISLFAPSGIGVREGIMVLGLKIIMPEQMAMIISVISRLWCTIPELILVVAAFIYGRVRKISFNKKEIMEMKK